MVRTNAENRSSQSSEESQDREPTSGDRSLGIIQLSSSEHGSYKVRTSGEDSNEPDTLVSGERTHETISGKIVRQLIEETEKQLAYYEQQAEILRDRLQELKEISIDQSE